ncbi:MAG: uroporphyrinogen decarboxylase family protein [Chloroflexi bacterium]|nr:uroporphyrinogen decarboxylase family protein [Chloroflexota bacterium]
MTTMTMTSRERILRAIDRQPTDVLPVAPMMLDLAATIADISIGEFATNGESMAHAQLMLHKELGQDVIFVGSDNYYIAAGFGCKIGTPDDEIPHLEEPAVENLADVYKLKVPNPLTDGRMPVMLDAARRVRAALGDTIALRTPGTGPFALASYFIGTQNWLVEVGLAHAGMPEANPDAIHYALNLAADALIAFGKACVDAGSDILHCGDSLSSCDMISPAQYETFAFPYQRKVIQAWKAYGARTLLHICGNSTKVLPLYAATGADIIEIDHKVDLAYAKRTVGDKVCILGNIDPVSTLLFATPDEVAAVAEKCVENAAAGGAYILGSGCVTPRNTPVENVQTLVKVARSHPNMWAN